MKVEHLLPSLSAVVDDNTITVSHSQVSSHLSSNDEKMTKQLCHTIKVDGEKVWMTIRL